MPTNTTGESELMVRFPLTGFTTASSGLVGAVYPLLFFDWLWLSVRLAINLPLCIDLFKCEMTKYNALSFTGFQKPI